MEIKVEKSEEQPLLSRKLVRGYVGFSGATPARAEFRKRLAEALKAEEGCVSVASLRTVFGNTKAMFEAHVYASAEALDRTESVVVLRRQGLREKKAAKAAAKA